MTIKSGNREIPMWPVITLLVSILIGGGGIYYGFAQAMANADHKVIYQKFLEDENQVKNIQEITVSNTFAIADLKVAVAALTAQVQELVMVMKGEYSR